MEREYKLKSKMLDAVTDRMDLIFNDKIEADQELKTVSARVTLDNFEKIANLSSMLQMSKSDFLRMIIVNACDDIIREYQINFETNGNGVTHSEMDEFENASVEQKKSMLEKWQQEAEVNKKEVSE